MIRVDICKVIVYGSLLVYKLNCGKVEEWNKILGCCVRLDYFWNYLDILFF